MWYDRYIVKSVHLRVLGFLGAVSFVAMSRARLYVYVQEVGLTRLSFHFSFSSDLCLQLSFYHFSVFFRFPCLLFSYSSCIISRNANDAIVGPAVQSSGVVGNL